MAFTFPSASDLSIRFPEFDGTDNATLLAALDEAQGAVGQHWNSQRDYTLGALFYAAHVLVMRGEGTGKEAAIFAAGMGSIRSISDGGVSLTRDVQSSARGSTTGDTTYGREYQRILRRNVIGVTVAGVSSL